MVRRIFWALPFALAGACSDGQLGDNGLVRFSQVVNFTETSNFESPIAANKAIFIALQRPDGSIFEDETFTELTLRVEDNENGGEDSPDATVFPLGFAQYGVILQRPGSFRLVAEDKEQFLDGIVVQSEEMSGIRLSLSATLTTFTDQCFIVEEIGGDINNFTLHPNQEIRVSIVPETATGAPMLGLLALTAESPDGLDLDSPLFGQGVTPNELIIRPGNVAFDLPADIIVNEVESNASITVGLNTSSDLAPVVCQ